MSNDSWQTPQDLFDVLDKGGEYMGIEFEGFNFDIDLCATRDNSKCDIWFNDYFEQDLSSDSVKGATCFMNPPYSNPLPFIEKAWHDSQWCKIICLVKVDTSTKWWGVFWNHTKGKDQCEFVIGPKLGCDVIFFPKRIKFDPPAEYKCKWCDGWGVVEGSNEPWCKKCTTAKGKKKLSGPNFPSCLIIMDRREIND